MHIFHFNDLWQSLLSLANISWLIFFNISRFIIQNESLVRNIFLFVNLSLFGRTVFGIHDRASQCRKENNRTKGTIWFISFWQKHLNQSESCGFLHPVDFSCGRTHPCFHCQTHQTEWQSNNRVNIITMKSIIKT